MSYQRWFLEQEARWARLEELLKKGNASTALLSPDELREMALLYREVIQDLSRTQSLPGFKHLEPYLNSLSQRVQSLVNIKPKTRAQDALDFFLIRFPQSFRRHSPFILASAFMFVLGMTIAMLTVHLAPETQEYFLGKPVIDALKQGVLWTDAQDAQLSQSAFLMTNNIRVAINAYVFGILFGVGTLLLMLHNGMFALGGPLQVCALYGMEGKLLNFVIAHGPLELTTIFIAGGAGMLIGFSLLFPGDRPRWHAVRESAEESLVLILGCFPLLVIAGLIEGLVSLNADVGFGTRLMVALMTVVLLTAYLGLAGRTRPTSKS